MFQLSECYSPRPIEFLDLVSRDGWRIKVYSIVYGSDPLDRAIYADGLELALRELPRPAMTAHRPGVGFAICHQGRGWHYLVMSWWDNENELPQHVYVRPIGAGDATWTRANETQAICVWDLQIISFERDAYVRFVLNDAPHIDNYLAAKFTLIR